eukprot:Em0655g6a
MGQSLSEPRTEKRTSTCENDMFLAATSSMQGWRIEMEDAHCIKLSLCEDKNSAYFAVFDGHGGANFAVYCSQHLHDEIIANENFGEGNITCAIQGGFLTLDKKLQDGNLALSRAFGDFNFKKNPNLAQLDQIVTVNPEILQFDITPNHEFIVLACDGIWDVMSNKEVVDFVRQKISEQMKPAQICESILDHCLAPDCRLGGVGCDNMTVIIVCFLNGPTHQFSEDRGRPRKSSTTCETSRDIEYACPIQPAKLDKFESHKDSSPNDLYDECAPDPDIAPETSV